MKKITIILFILLLTWQSVFRSSFIIYWKINQNYIAKTLCENKNKPMLHCDGKCYLRKQLAKLEEKTTDKNNIPISISNQKTIDDFVFEDNSKGFKNYFFTSKSNHSISKHPDFDIQKGYKNSVFRPPIFI